MSGNDAETLPPCNTDWRKSAGTYLPLIVDNIMRITAYPEKKRRSSRIDGGHKMPAKITWKD
jgi:hypothetical protein